MLPDLIVHTDIGCGDMIQPRPVHCQTSQNKSYWLRDHTTGSRNIKPEAVFKVKKMAQYASFCLIMDPFKGKCLFCQIMAH